jgi:hypothetical protein
MADGNAKKLLSRVQNEKTYRISSRAPTNERITPRWPSKKGPTGRQSRERNVSDGVGLDRAEQLQPRLFCLFGLTG